MAPGISKSSSHRSGASGSGDPSLALVLRVWRAVIQLGTVQYVRSAYTLLCAL